MITITGSCMQPQPNIAKCHTRKGFTLMELIAVIAVLAILAGILIPVFSGAISKARQAADEANLRLINTLTVLCASKIDKTPAEVFDALGSDHDRLQRLVDEDYLSEVPVPLQTDMVFQYIVGTGTWELQPRS